MITHPTITRALRWAFGNDGRTQREIAKAIGTHQANISCFLTRKQTVTLVTADAWLAALGYEIVLVPVRPPATERAPDSTGRMQGHDKA